MARVLVVDDSLEMRRTIRDILELDGHVVEEAQYGGDAARLIRASPFDLVVTDLLMPVADGRTVLRAVADGAPGVAVIGISGGGPSMPAAVSLSMLGAFGAHRLLYKPFGAAELRAAVDELLSRRR